METRWKAWAFLGTLCMILAGVGCGKDYVTGKSSYNWYSINKDVSLGKQVLNSQLAAFQKGSQKYKGQKVEVDKDTEQLDRLRSIMERLSKVSHLPNLPYEVHLAEIPVVNAWAAPGGKMMVYSGLWDPKKGLVDKDNEDQIAAVMAHEMSHATARHVTETVSRNMTILLAGTVARTAIGAAGSQMGANMFGNFFSYGFNIYAPTYSRNNEYEADRIGLFYMAKAGFDPREAIKVWEKAAKKKGDMTSIYASHPSNGDRASALKKYLPLAMKIYENPDYPYPDFGELDDELKKNREKKAKVKEPAPETKAAKAPKSDLPETQSPPSSQTEPTPKKKAPKKGPPPKVDTERQE